MHNSGNVGVETTTTTTTAGGGGPSSSGPGHATTTTTTYGMTPEQASREFDALRREATRLERHLEDRVARYQQVRHPRPRGVFFDYFSGVDSSSGRRRRLPYPPGPPPTPLSSFSFRFFFVPFRSFRWSRVRGAPRERDYFFFFSSLGARPPPSFFSLVPVVRSRRRRLRPAHARILRHSLLFPIFVCGGGGGGRGGGGGGGGLVVFLEIVCGGRGGGGWSGNALLVVLSPRGGGGTNVGCRRGRFILRRRCAQKRHVRPNARERERRERRERKMGDRGGGGGGTLSFFIRIFDAMRRRTHSRLPHRCLLFLLPCFAPNVLHDCTHRPTPKSPFSPPPPPFFAEKRTSRSSPNA